MKYIDEQGYITCYEHDPNGNVVEVIAPDGGVTRFVYDEVGHLIETIDPMGDATKRKYDLVGQLIEIADPLGNTTQFTYNLLGQVEKSTNAKSDSRTQEYYPGGNLKSVTLPEGESESYEYDENGNTVKVIDALGHETSFLYDCLDRVVEVVNPLGHSKRFEYDALGNITVVVDESGNRTEYRYSLLGDIIEVIDAMGNSTKYGYDSMSRLTKVEQIRLIDDALAGIRTTEQQVTTYERNQKGQIIAVHLPLDKFVRFAYNGMGNITSKQDEDGFETLYEYNLAGKLAQVAYADGKTVKFSYNLLGQLFEMQDWLGTTTVEMDELGRPKKVVDFAGKVVGYDWNALGQREKTIYPDESEVLYQYNASGNLSSVQSASGLTQYRYDTMGRIAQQILPDGTVSKYEVNPLGKIASLTHQHGNKILDEFRYSYDPVGNITQIEKQRAGVETDSGLFQYVYDPLGRLVEAVHGKQSKQYFYDSLGNRIGSVQEGNEIRHTYNAGNQLIQTERGKLVQDYRYDGRGNLNRVYENGQLKARYTYDATNMMTSAFTAGKGKAEYAYNGLRKRVKKLERLHSLGDLPDPCNELHYTLDLIKPYNNLLATEGAQNQNFIWGNNLLETVGGENYFYLQDHLGSPTRLLDGKENGTALAYDEFGVPLVGASKNSNPFGFTGYQTDEVTGLYYAQARYYDAGLGRFGAVDIIKGVTFAPITLNEYTYCWGSPLIFVDLDGETPNKIDAEDGKEAHQFLQAYFLATQNSDDVLAEVEKRVYWQDTKSGYGKADMVATNKSTGDIDVYEIKPGAHSKKQSEFYQSSIDQLGGYIAGLQEMNPKSTVQAGTSFVPEVVFPSKRNEGYYITYHTYYEDPKREGMIYWGYVKKPDGKQVWIPDLALVPADEKEEAKVAAIDWRAFGNALGDVVMTLAVIAITLAMFFSTGQMIQCSA